MRIRERAYTYLWKGGLSIRTRIPRKAGKVEEGEQKWPVWFRKEETLGGRATQAKEALKEQNLTDALPVELNYLFHLARGGVLLLLLFVR